MSQPSHAPPTRADLEALPSGVKGEIIDGVLYAMTRPRPKHQALGTRLRPVEQPVDLLPSASRRRIPIAFVALLRCLLT